MHTDGDSLTQSIEDSSGPGEIIIEKNTDDYIVDMKKGNSNILVRTGLFLALQVTYLSSYTLGGRKMQTIK